MPPQPSARCCRVVQQQISTPLESIWITDSVLSQALERYCSISRVARRHASSAPGPLENRRRLGKRNIAELNSLQSHAALPAWALSNAADLSQWKWEPPTTSPAVRFQKESRTAPARWPFPAVRLADWLGDFAEEKEATIPEEKVHAVRAGSISVLKELEELSSAAASLPASTFAQTFQTFCEHYQQQFVLGLIKGDEAFDVLNRALAVLDAKLERSPHKAIIKEQYLVLLESVVRGISSSRVLMPSALSSKVWHTILIRLSEQQVSDNFCHLFAQTMSVIPQRYVQEMETSWLLVLDTVFKSWSQPDQWNEQAVAMHLNKAEQMSQKIGRMITTIESYLKTKDLARAQSMLDKAQSLVLSSNHHPSEAARAMSSHQRQISSISDTLRNILPGESLSFIRIATDTASKRAIQGSFAPEIQHRIQYNWLRVLACMSSISQEYLFEVSSSAFLAEGSLPLSSTEICQLLLDHWTSRGYLENSNTVRETFETLNGNNESTAIASLASALHKRRGHNKCAGYLYSIWKYLRCLGRADEFVTSLKELKQLRSISPRVIKNVAFTSDDHKVALALHSVSAEYFHKPHLQWGPGFWDKYMEEMAADPAVGPDRLLQVLAVKPQAQAQKTRVDTLQSKAQEETQAGKADAGRTRQHNRSVGPVQAQVARVQKAAILLSQAPHLRNRVALRHVERCIRYLGHRNRRWSVAEVTALARILTRDLSRGEAGRTERLRWLLRLISETFGERVAFQCGLHLKRWRNGNWRLLQQSK